MDPPRRIAVFCGSNLGADRVYRDAAETFAAELAARGWGLVYGGGNVGLMGVVADRVLRDGGEVIGVIPQALHDLELAHHGVSELRLVATMHERKRTMYALADAAVALPGGVGTFEELLEAFTWTQLGFHQVACGLLDVAGYWQPLVGLLDHAVREGFLRAEHRDLLVVEADGGRLLDRLVAQRPLAVPKWHERPPPRAAAGERPERDRP